MSQLMPRLNAAGTAWEAHPSEAVKRPPYQISSADVANAAAVATLPAVAGKTGYITGFEVWSGGATVGALVDVTISGLLGGSITCPFAAPAVAVVGTPPLILDFPVAKPASAVNTAISVTLPALGAGHAKGRTVIKGYYLP